MNDADLIAKIINSELNLNNYKSMNPEEKQFVANNADLINKVLTGKGSIEEFNKYPALMKLFNGVDATGRPVAFAKSNIESFNKTKAPAKSLDAKNNTTQPVANAQSTINSMYGRKVDLTASNQTAGGRNAAQGTVNSLYGRTVNLYSDNQIWGGISAALLDLDKLPKYRGISIGIERVGGGEKLPPGLFNAKGTPGLPQDQWAIINDQKGPLYEELVTPPGGKPFIIPKQRDVLIPLKKGTRIDKASETEKIKRGLPHFANGLNNQQPLPFIGYNATFKPTTVSRVDTSSSVLDPGTSKVIQLLQLIYEKDMDVILNGKSVLDYFEKEMTRRSRV